MGTAAEFALFVYDSLYLNEKYLAAITGKTQATDSLTRSFKAWEQHNRNSEQISQFLI